MMYFLSVIGVVLIFEGMPWFLTPNGTKRVLDQLRQLSNARLRIFGLSAMIIGLILVRLSIST